MRSQRVSTLCRLSIVAGATLAVVLGTAVNAKAQALKDVQTSDTPLVLKAQGSFFIGGERSNRRKESWVTSGLGATLPSIRCTSGTWCRRAPTATRPW